MPRGTARLDRAGIAKCSEIYTLWKERFEGPSGTLPRAIMKKVDCALAIGLSLPFLAAED
jgi:mRNA-degrading endonuclease toxin of MazEF toxin-antitoxin module